jgi:hypothetical protein
MGAALMAASRRAVLRDRLIALGKAAEQQELPFDVLQILGFGSFFRGKQSPKDVDLVLRVDRRTERFTVFRELVEKLQADPSYEEAFETPRKAMLHLCSTDAAVTRWPAERREWSAARYSEWLAAYSWNMLHPRTEKQYFALMGTDAYAIRVMRKRFPNININAIITDDDGTNATLAVWHGFEVVVWTKDATNVSATLAMLLTDGTVRQNIVKDIVHFGLQRQCLLTQLCLCREEVAVLRDPTTPPPPRFTVNDAAWQAGIPRLVHAAAASEQAHSASVAFRTSGTVDSKACDELNALDTRTLAEQADSARKTIKDLQEQLELWSELKEQLLCARHEPNVGSVPIDELTAALMLSRGERRRLSRKRDFLDQHGFPGDVDIDETLLRSRRGY